MQNTIRKKRPKNQQVWGFIGLSLVFSSVFLLYPIVYSLYLSLHRTQGLQSVFVGFGNYLRMLQDTIFQKALLNNFIFLIFQVPIMVLLGLLLAFVLNTPKLVGRSFFKLALFLPCVTSLVSYAVLFKMMFQIGGIVNQGLLNIGLITQPLDWLNNPLLAKLTVIIALCWRWTGYNMIFYLAGLQNISDDTLEAAAIDGANGFQKFFKITLPSIRGQILYTVVITTIAQFNIYGQPLMLTGGGPANSTRVLLMDIQQNAFGSGQSIAGIASAMAILLGVCIMIVSFIQFLFLRNKE